MIKYFACILVGAACQFACTHTDAQLHSSQPRQPFKVGVINMSPEIDDVKPLAEADFTGWLESSGVLVGSTDNQWVTGYELASKKTLWWLKGNADFASPITGVSNWVILGFRDGTFMKVDAKTGKKEWEINLDSFSARKAAFADGQLFILTTSQQLYGIDFDTGSTQWLYDGGYPDGLHFEGAAAPITDGKMVIVGLANGQLHAVDAKSGRRLWVHDGSFEPNRFHDVMGTIVMREKNIIYARYDGSVQSIDFSGVAHQTDWEMKVSAVTATTVHNGKYYIGCLNGDVHVVDLMTGNKLWTTPTGQTISSITSSDTTVYVGGANGRVNAISALNGELLWHDDLDSELSTPPVAIDGSLYFATGFKNLYGYKIF